MEIVGLREAEPRQVKPGEKTAAIATAAELSSSFKLSSTRGGNVLTIKFDLCFGRETEEALRAIADKLEAEGPGDQEAKHGR